MSKNIWNKTILEILLKLKLPFDCERKILEDLLTCRELQQKKISKKDAIILIQENNYRDSQKKE